jgi:hypothetical protein
MSASTNAAAPFATCLPANVLPSSSATKRRISSKSTAPASRLLQAYMQCVADQCAAAARRHVLQLSDVQPIAGWSRRQAESSSRMGLVMCLVIWVEIG